MRMQRAKWVLAVASAAMLSSAAAAAYAEAAQQGPFTPKNWSYELRDGKRVPKANRTETVDGGWREEVRQGQCTTVKEKTGNGDYSETRKCD